MKLVNKQAFAILISVAALVGLVSIFLPEVVSFGWHFVHGSSAEFLVWEVPVPWGWRELRGDGFVVIQKIGRWNNAPSDAIVAKLDLPVGSAINLERLKKGIMETELKKGLYFKSQTEIQLDGETGFCMTFSDEHPDLRWIDCDFPIHRLSVGYVGTEYHSHVLDSIIHGIKANK